MLQTATVEKGTYELLKKLMKDDLLSDFLLAGGTNLALQERFCRYCIFINQNVTD